MSLQQPQLNLPWLENMHSHNAIFMCFITSSLQVRFEDSNSHGQYQVYDTLRGDRSGRRMFMWTRDTKLLQDESYYDRVAVYHSTDGRGNGLGAEDVDKGWIVMLARESQVEKTCQFKMVEKT